MATTYSAEATLALNSTPSKFVPVAKWGGRLRRFRATITLAAQAIADDVVLFKLPSGSLFAYGVLNSSATLGATATVAVGVAGTPAKYRAAAVHTTPNLPVLFGLNSAVDDEPLTGDEDVILTVGVAALPASGTLIVDMYVSNG